MHRLAVLTLLALLGSTASAHPPPPPLEVASSSPTTVVEWSTWLRGAIGVASGDPDPVAVARTSTPIREAGRRLFGAAGAGVTLSVGSHARIGAWAEVRGWDTPLVGGELTLIPGDLDMFFYKGKSAITARAGGNPSLRTAQLGVAYRAPWDLRGAQPRTSRYMIGVGLVANVTQNRLDPHDWSATVGLEFEPVGALRYVLGIRSWY